MTEYAIENQRDVLLISPIEPSGVTWLINCLLILGIRTWRRHNSGKRMWIQCEQDNRLSPHENLLQRWLPALSEQEQFRFEDGINVRWCHEWPAAEHQDQQVIFFIRDPKDALFSRYKRDLVDASYPDYLEFPDPSTLLGKIDNWTLFCLSWLNWPDVTLVRFEDYKSDAMTTLQNVLSALQINRSHEEMTVAVERSTQSRAAEVEKQYLEKFPSDEGIINRAGKVGDWMTQGIPDHVTNRIQARAHEVLLRSGYSADQSVSERLCYAPNVEILPFFQDIEIPQEIRSRHSRVERERIQSLVDFEANLVDDDLIRMNFLAYQKQYLSDSLKIFLGKYATA